MSFGLKLLLVLFSIGACMFIVNWVLRKIFKVESKKWFSYNHVNEKHKKIDSTMRLSFMALILIQFIFAAKNEFMNNSWYFKPYYLMFVFIIATEAVRAVMEKRYAANKNQYLVTTFQLVIIGILLAAVVPTHFFGWFDQAMLIP